MLPLFFVGFVFLLFFLGGEFFHWRRASFFFAQGVANDMELTAFAAAFAASDFVTTTTTTATTTTTTTTTTARLENRVMKL